MSGDGRYSLRKRKAVEISGPKRSKTTAEKVEVGILSEIMAELKNIREKIDENQKENEKKLEEMKIENREIRRKLEENQKLQAKNTADIAKELSLVRQTVFKSLPIKEAILGRWKMVQHENFQGFQMKMKQPFGRFSEDVTYRMDGTSTAQIGGVYPNQNQELERCYVEDNTFFKEYKNGMTIERYVADGKLFDCTAFDGESWMRIYERIK